MEKDPHSQQNFLTRLKDRLGIFRIPLGLLFLLVALFLIVTPLTPGSMITLYIGLELLNLRERGLKRLRQFKQRYRTKE